MGIYYFSGTGNSYHVAKQLSKTLDLEMRPIHKGGIVDPLLVDDHDEVVGFVFPVYDFKAPPDVIQSIKQIKWDEAAYVFAVATYGVGSLGTYSKLCKELDPIGKSMTGGFGIMMPHNAVGSERLSDEDIKKKPFKERRGISGIDR